MYHTQFYFCHITNIFLLKIVFERQNMSTHRLIKFEKGDFKSFTTTTPFYHPFSPNDFFFRVFGRARECPSPTPAPGVGWSSHFTPSPDILFRCFEIVILCVNRIFHSFLGCFSSQIKTQLFKLKYDLNIFHKCADVSAKIIFERKDRV